MVFFDEPEACMGIKHPSTPKLVQPLNLSRDRGEEEHSSCMHANRLSNHKPSHVMFEYEPDSKPEYRRDHILRHSRVSNRGLEHRQRVRNKGLNHVYPRPAAVCLIPAIPVPVSDFCFFDFIFGGMIFFFYISYNLFLSI